MYRVRDGCSEPASVCLGAMSLQKAKCCGKPTMVRLSIVSQLLKARALREQLVRWNWV